MYDVARAAGEKYLGFCTRREAPCPRRAAPSTQRAEVQLMYDGIVRRSFSGTDSKDLVYHRNLS
jgi:hypothetical protein